MIILYIAIFYLIFILVKLCEIAPTNFVMVIFYKNLESSTLQCGD